MNNLWHLIDESKSILVMTHESPDGDAVGSAMAVFYYLTGLKKDVDVVIPEFSSKFLFLENSNSILDKSDKLYDLAIIVDCSSKERIGQLNNEFGNCKKTLIIDHHKSNTNYGDINYVLEKISSCCQVIYKLFKEKKIVIDKRIGESLMLGAITDTNGFGNDNVDSDTFLMVADMINLGVDIHKIYANVLWYKSHAQLELTKIVLNRLEFLEDGKIAFAYITKNDMASTGAVLGEHEGLVELGRNVDGVWVSIFMREDNGYKVSFRSNGMIQVNEIALRLGGGGHSLSAGAKIDMSFEEAKKVLIQETIKEIHRQ